MTKKDINFYDAGWCGSLRRPPLLPPWAEGALGSLPHQLFLDCDAVSAAPAGDYEAECRHINCSAQNLT